MAAHFRSEPVKIFQDGGGFCLNNCPPERAPSFDTSPLFVFQGFTSGSNEFSYISSLKVLTSMSATGGPVILRTLEAGWVGASQGASQEGLESQ